MSFFNFAANKKHFTLFKKKYSLTSNYFFACILIVIFALVFGAFQINKILHLKNLESLFVQRSQLDAIFLRDLDDHNADWRFYPIQLDGSFDTDHQIFVSRKNPQGEMGYNIFTPFRQTNHDKAILVDRGWFSPESNAVEARKLKGLKGRLSIRGILVQPNIEFLSFADKNGNLENVKWPLKLKGIEIGSVAAALNYPLFRYVALLDTKNLSLETNLQMYIGSLHAAYLKLGAAFAVIISALLSFLSLNMRRQILAEA